MGDDEGSNWWETSEPDDGPAADRPPDPTPAPAPAPPPTPPGPSVPRYPAQAPRYPAGSGLPPTPPTPAPPKSPAPGSSGGRRSRTRLLIAAVIIVGAAAAVILVLSRHKSSPAATPPTDPRAAYAADVRSASTGTLVKSASDTDLVALGHGVCGKLSQESPGRVDAEMLATAHGSPAFPAGDAVVVIRSAVKHLCPARLGLLNGWSGTPDTSPTTAARVAAGCDATIANARPAAGSSDSVAITSPVPNTAGNVALRAGTTETLFRIHTDASGKAALSFPLGRLAAGTVVTVTANVGTATCSTTFTPA